MGFFRGSSRRDADRAKVVSRYAGSLHPRVRGVWPELSWQRFARLGVPICSTYQGDATLLQGDGNCQAAPAPTGRIDGRSLGYVDRQAFRSAVQEYRVWAWYRLRD